MDNRIIKGYELRERIGAGGFGAVYRANQLTVGREVAIKVILPEHANQPDFVRRFEVEAQLIARLEHPHIVPMYDYWRDPEGAYLVMRWLKSSLRASTEHTAWQVNAAARMLEQIAAGLNIAHREGVIHRDIKPDNILLDEDDNAYLADFGIAKDVHVGGITEPGSILGSPDYITPEQIKGDAVSPRSDIYSLGLVMYEVLTAEKPYPDATTIPEIISRHLNTPLPMAALHRPNVPAAIDEVLQTATAKNPEHRYANVLRFAAAFRAAIPNIQRAVSQPLPDPLTDRELEILRLMAEGLSNREIADKLVLAATTVKWYVNEIYSKLDVHSRNKAVERAHQLGLLDPNSLFRSAAGYAAAAVPTVISGKSQSAIVRVPELVNPYKGLRAFQEADAVDFFGRAALTEQLLARLSSSDEGARFLAVVGPSGSGKSSVVKAGLVPALRKGGLLNSARWYITEMMPGTHPLEELESALLHVSVNPLPGLLDQLGEDRRGLVRAVKRILPHDNDVELVLVIDQFEELFTLTTDEAMRVHFIDNLLSAATDPRGRVRVILTLRADFYDRPLVYPRLAEMMRSHAEIILPLSASELERAIAGPADRVGLTLESGLVATIVNDVGQQPGTLPLLQYALSELYERRVDHQLTLSAYREMDGLSGALARRADEIYESLNDSGKVAARQLFLRLITLGEGVEDTRRRTLQAELSSLLDDNSPLDDVIDLYSQYRLLTFDRDPVTRSPTIEIAHEALIREWGRLRGWIGSSREALHVQRRLMALTADWMSSGKEPSFLASGARLVQFEVLRADDDIRLNQDERDYLEASIREREQQRRAEQQRNERELHLARETAQAQERAANRLQYIVASLALFLVVAAGLAMFAFNSRTDAINNAVLAQDNYTRAESERLAVEANKLRLTDGNSEVVALLAIRAMRLQYSAEGDEALTNAAVSNLPIRRYIGHSDLVFSARFSPDGKYLVSASKDNTVRIWDIQTGKDIRAFTVPHVSVDDAAFSPDERYVITASADGAVLLWSVSTGQQVRALRNADLTNANRAIAFLPNSHYVAMPHINNTVGLWDIETGQVSRQFTGLGEQIINVAASANGQYLLASGAHGDVGLWDCTTGVLLKRFINSQAIALSPDGRFAATGHDFSIAVWDTTTGNNVRNIVLHAGELRSLTFSPDGYSLLSTGYDGTANLWDIETGNEIRQFVGHRSLVFDAEYSPDGKYIATAGSDNTILLWNANGYTDLAQLIQHKDIVDHVAVSLKGNFILTTGADGSAKIWDAHTGQKLQEWIFNSYVPGGVFSPDEKFVLTDGGYEKESLIYDVQTGQPVQILLRPNVIKNSDAQNAFSPDGKYAVTSEITATGGNFVLWDVQTGKMLRKFVGHSSEDLFTAAFSPDGKYLATAGFDKTARLWDVLTSKQLLQFNHATAVSSVAYSPDGKTILTGSWDNMLRLWDVKSGQLIRQFSGHTDVINEVNFSPDGRYALSASSDRTARLWDVQTGKEVRRFVGHTNTIESAAFFPDGRRVITGSDDETVRIWDVSYQDTISALCARLIRDFTDEERQQYGITDTYATCPVSAAPDIGPTWTPIPLTPLPSDTPVETPANPNPVF